jgi:hypothetical protein
MTTVDSADVAALSLRSWEAVQVWSRQQYRLAHDGDFIGLVLGFGEGAAQVRQSVRLRPLFAVDERWLEIAAEVESAVCMDAWHALAHNGLLAVGALALEEGLLIVRALLPLRHADGGTLSRTIDLVGYEAARLRREDCRRLSCDEWFTIYAEKP